MLHFNPSRIHWEKNGINTGRQHVAPGYRKAYAEKSATALSQPDIQNVSKTQAPQPVLTSVSAEKFLSNPILHQEVFGPFSLVVTCKDMSEMLAVAAAMEGQLTCTIIAEEKRFLNTWIC